MRVDVLRKLVQTIALGAALTTATAAQAQGAEVLSLQAQMVNGGWSAPAPGQRAAACFVDSGLDAGQIDIPSMVALSTVPGIGSGAPPSGTSAAMHGTQMAQYVAAPQDGVGMIGPAPGVPLIMVRAMRDNTDNFSGGDYADGIRRCKRIAVEQGWRLAAISLALGGDGVAAEDRRQVQRASQEVGVPVFAAAGNRRGIPMFPASETGVIGVSALHTQTGAVCAGHADPDPEADGVAAPGCYVTLPVAGVAQTVVSAGTSGATSLMAMSVAQVCDLAPSLAPQACWDVVRNTARPVAGGRVVDLRAAAAAVGVIAPAPPSAPVPVVPVVPDVIPPGALVRTPSQISVDSPVAPGTPMPKWYREGRVPKVRWISRTKVRVSSPERKRKARLWTDLRGAKAGRLKATSGKPRKVRGYVKVRVRQTVGKVVFTRTWRIKLAPRPAKRPAKRKKKATGTRR